MDNTAEFWDACHERFDSGRLKEENCWNRYADRFIAGSGPALDLACGTGSDSLWLKNRRIPAIACDYSLKRLNLFHAYLPEIPALCFDMTQTFPFADEVFGILICDMGLHFFPERDTFAILNEIRRILKKSGTAFFRVNAIEDLLSEKIAAEIEPHFYALKNDVNMRYFTKEDICLFFGSWNSCEAERTQMTRYGGVRETWTICCRK